MIPVLKPAGAILAILLFCNGAFAQNSFQCPRDNGTVQTDANGERYIIGCGNDMFGNSNGNVAAANSFNDCFSACSSSPTTCGGFTYVGGANGVGAGTCYLKPASSPSTFQRSTDPSFVAAINMRYYQSPTATSTSVRPTETFACPAQDGSVVTDKTGVQYVLGCQRDTTGNSFTSQQVLNGFGDCFYYCSNNILVTCYWFTFVGGSDTGKGEGTCYLKNSGQGDFTGNSVAWVGAIQVNRYNGPAITWPTTTTTTSATTLTTRAITASPSVLSLEPRQAQGQQTVYYTTVQYVTTTVVTSYPVTATSVSTRLQTFTSSITVTATRITTLPDVTTTLQLTTIVPTTVVTTQVYTTVVSTITTLQLTTVVPTTVVTTRFGTTVQVTTIAATVTTTIIPVVTVTPTTVYGQTVTVTPSFS